MTRSARHGMLGFALIVASCGSRSSLLVPDTVGDISVDASVSCDAVPGRCDRHDADVYPLDVLDAPEVRADVADVPDVGADAPIDAPLPCTAPHRSCESLDAARCTRVYIPSSAPFVLGERNPAYQGGIEPWSFPSPGPAQITVHFCSDAHEVTVERFRAFWRATMPRVPADVITPGGSVSGPFEPHEPRATRLDAQCNWSRDPGARDAHPVNCVDWATAMAFCVWDGGRLPTEAEWEWMAQGRAIDGLASGRGYPWGEVDPSGSATTPCDRAQRNACRGDDGAITRRVGSFAASGAIFDLSGNVWEWAADTFRFYADATCWGPTARTNPLCNVASDRMRVARGGSWDANLLFQVRASARARVERDRQGNSVGFRCISPP